MTSDEPANSPASRGADPAPADAVRVAVVRHELGNGEGDDADHLDLFVAPAEALGAGADPNARIARTWRLPLAAWDGASEGLACGRFAAIEIERHRAEYLALAQPRALSGDRGRVVPLLRGAGVAQENPSPRGVVVVVIAALGRELRLSPASADPAPVDAAAREPSRACGTIDISRQPSAQDRVR